MFPCLSSRNIHINPCNGNFHLVVAFRVHSHFFLFDHFLQLTTCVKKLWFCTSAQRSLNLRPWETSTIQYWASNLVPSQIPLLLLENSACRPSFRGIVRLFCCFKKLLPHLLKLMPGGGGDYDEKIDSDIPWNICICIELARTNTMMWVFLQHGVCPQNHNSNIQNID